MAKKKAAIGDLIKSDMSRRAIKEGPKTTKEAELFSGEGSVKKPSEKKPQAEKAAPPVSEAVSIPVVVPASGAPVAPVAVAPEGSAGFMAFIAEQARPAGLTDEADLYNFYAFLQSQAMRYLRGIDAGRRFHG